MDIRKQLICGALSGKKAWTPSTALSGYSPLVWLKSDSIVASDGDAIAAWNSISPGSINLAQADADKKPLYKTNILNGLPALLFDGSNDGLTSALDLSAYDKATIFLICTAAHSATTINMIMELGTSLFSIYRDVDDTVHSLHSQGANYSNFKNVVPLTDAPKIITTTHDYSLSTNEAVVWVNGVSNLAGSGCNPNNNCTGNFASNTLSLGSRGNGASLPLSGYIFEVLIYPGVVMSAADRLIVENYLYNKWMPSALVTDFVDNAYFGVEAIANVNGGTFIRTSPSARLVFTTDAETAYVRVHNDIYATYPAFSDIGVRVNGVDLGVVEPGIIGETTTKVALGAGAGKTVEIVNGIQSKPTTTRIGSFVKGVTFSALAGKASPTLTPRLLIYGDSIAAGGNADNPSLEGWVQLVRGVYPNSVLVEAWGYRSLFEDCATAGARTTFANFIASQNPTTIWLAIGTNDYGNQKWSSSDFGTAYADLLDKLNAALPSAVIYAQTPIDRTTETEVHAGWGALGDYRAAIATAVSTRTAYCTLVAGEDWSITLDDGIHPTTAGQAAYAAAVKTVLGL